MALFNTNVALFQTSDVSVFEVNIRFVGGMLACYALTGDVVSTDLMWSEFLGA